MSAAGPAATARRAAAVACLALAAAPARAGGGPAEPQPFPVSKTTILRDETAVYFVEGRQLIPRGVEVTVLKGIRILGRGKDPTLEVEGSLKIHGVRGTEVFVEGVNVEPAATFDAIRLDMAGFSKGAGIRTRKGTPTTGYFMLELLDLDRSAAIDLELAAGSVELSSVCSESPVRVRAVDAAATKGNQVKVEVRGCDQQGLDRCPFHQGRRGLTGGLVVESVNEVVVRLSRLGGETTAVRDWRKSLIFDGNKVDSKALEFTQPVAGRFKTCQFFKCDVYANRVAFSAPPARPGETEDVNFERWYFARTDSDRAEVEKLIDDAADAPAKNGARAKWSKLNDRPLELAGSAPGK